MSARPHIATAAVIATERLVLRRLVVADAPFVLELVNDPSWLRFIGDKGVRTLDDARAYITNGPQASYARHDFGLWLVELKSARTPLGICGLIRRDTLDDVDIGFAFLPSFRGQGHALEAAAATVRHARECVRLERLVAIVSPGNAASIRLLEKLGMRFERMLQLSAGAPDTALYGMAL